MPTYTHTKWESGPAGWELWGVDSEQPMQEFVELLAWVFPVHRTGKWHGIVYQVSGDYFEVQQEFNTLEDAQAWCVACVRVS
jgi:hypothetical protein